MLLGAGIDRLGGVGRVGGVGAAAANGGRLGLLEEHCLGTRDGHAQRAEHVDAQPQRWQRRLGRRVDHRQPEAHEHGRRGSNIERCHPGRRALFQASMRRTEVKLDGRQRAVLGAHDETNHRGSAHAHRGPPHAQDALEVDQRRRPYDNAHSKASRNAEHTHRGDPHVKIKRAPERLVECGHGKLVRARASRHSVPARAHQVWVVRPEREPEQVVAHGERSECDQSDRGGHHCAPDLEPEVRVEDERHARAKHREHCGLYHEPRHASLAREEATTEHKRGAPLRDRSVHDRDEARLGGVVNG
mmetsp:Transcript_17766/g.45942  ORF Transcript_17766/g.45942 Transcript_17766/m.45942 type:complete len:302 (+) Transcript_17766:463-1368(+)